MLTLKQMMILGSSGVVAVLGGSHLMMTYYGKWFHPQDAAIKKLLETHYTHITQQSTLWQASKGFHVSHSFGILIFAAYVTLLVYQYPSIFFNSYLLQGAGLIYLSAMLILAKKYWFFAPFYGLAASTILYMGGLLL